MPVAKRGNATGWSQGAARRNSEFLQSLRLEELPGVAYALTLTIPAGRVDAPIAPPTAEVYHRLLRSFIERLRRLGALRWHWVIEFTARKTPHVHMAVWMPTRSIGFSGDMLAHWLQLTAKAGWPAGIKAQDCKRLDNVGWLQYMAKHGARGVRMYQRAASALPEGWERPGRMWGYGGSFPSPEERQPLRFDVEPGARTRYRRLLRSWAIANARATENPRLRARYVRQARRLLRCTDPALSPVRNVSMWVPEDVQLQLLGLLVSEGWNVVERVPEPEKDSEN